MLDLQGIDIDKARAVLFPQAEQALECERPPEPAQDVISNCLQRICWMEIADKDSQAQQIIRGWCVDDVVWFASTWCWGKNRRDYMENPLRPIIPWGHQADALRKIDGAIGKHSVVMDKSRQEGGTLHCLIVFAKHFIWTPDASLLVCAASDEKLNGRDDSLFWKLDTLFCNLPDWLRPSNYAGCHSDEEVRNCHNLKQFTNRDTSGVIETTNNVAEVGRGGTRTAILLDEFAECDSEGKLMGKRMLAASMDVTNCRIFNSTTRGPGNAYYDVKQLPGVPKIRLHWSDNPHKTKGLYRAWPDGKIEYLDKTRTFSSDYPFIRDGKLRSPWYDKQCDETPYPWIVAREIDCDDGASEPTVFQHESISSLIADPDYCQPAFHVGKLMYEIDEKKIKPTQFIEVEHESLKLWIHPDQRGQIPGTAQYIVGVDPAIFSSHRFDSETASEAAICVYDCNTFWKVAEFSSRNVTGFQLAQLAIALCKWFNSAFLIWESNGPAGSQVREQVCIRTPYPHIYYNQLDEDNPYSKSSMKPGFYRGAKSGPALIESYSGALFEKRLVNRSRKALRQCMYYVYSKDGKIKHKRSLRSDEPTEHQENHGDLVIADALCWHELIKRGRVAVQTGHEEALEYEHSFSGRRRRWKQQERAAGRRRVWVRR